MKQNKSILNPPGNRIAASEIEFIKKSEADTEVKTEADTEVKTEVKPYKHMTIYMPNTLLKELDEYRANTVGAPNRSNLIIRCVIEFLERRGIKINEYKEPDNG